MVTLYSYKPESADSTTKAISFGILGGAGALILLSEILAEYKPVLQTAGFVVALFGVLFFGHLLYFAAAACVVYFIVAIIYTVKLM